MATTNPEGDRDAEGTAELGRDAPRTRRTWKRRYGRA